MYRRPVGVSYRPLTVECDGSCSRENTTSHVVLAWRTPLEAPGLSFPRHRARSRARRYGRGRGSVMDITNPSEVTG